MWSECKSDPDQHSGSDINSVYLDTHHSNTTHPPHLARNAERFLVRLLLPYHNAVHDILTQIFSIFYSSSLSLLFLPSPSLPLPLPPSLFLFPLSLSPLLLPRRSLSLSTHSLTISLQVLQ